MRRERHCGCSDNLFCHRCLFVNLDPDCSPGSTVPESRAAAAAPGRAVGCSPDGSCIEPNYPSGAACKPPPASSPAARSARSWTWAPTRTHPGPGWRSQCPPWPDTPGLGWTQLTQHGPLASAAPRGCRSPAGLSWLSVDCWICGPNRLPGGLDTGPGGCSPRCRRGSGLLQGNTQGWRGLEAEEALSVSGLDLNLKQNWIICNCKYFYSLLTTFAFKADVLSKKNWKEETIF